MVKYKLAFVIERFFEFGGLQRNMRQLAFVCAQKGHDVTVFTRRWEGPAEPKLNVQIIDVEAWTNHGTIKKIAGFVKKLRQQNEFDCITGFNRLAGLDIYYGGDVCLKAKLQRQHRLWQGFLPRYRTYLQLEEAVFGPASDTDIMLISPAEAENYRQGYNTTPERIHLLPPGIDRDRLTANPMTAEQKSAFRKSLGIPDSDLLILTVGSSFHTKGIDRVIRAVAALPEELKNLSRYVVVGLGDEKKYRAIAQTEGIDSHVFFAGGRDNVGHFYTAADLLVHPARTENTGNTLLEAMVTGLPVLATENCGYSFYIRQAEAGLICPEPFDQNQLNTMLYEILANEQKRIQYAANGRRYCQTADIYSRTEKGVNIILARAQKNREGR